MFKYSRYARSHRYRSQQIVSIFPPRFLIICWLSHPISRDIVKKNKKKLIISNYQNCAQKSDPFHSSERTNAFSFDETFRLTNERSQFSLITILIRILSRECHPLLYRSNQFFSEENIIPLDVFRPMYQCTSF